MQLCAFSDFFEQFIYTLYCRRYSENEDMINLIQRTNTMDDFRTFLKLEMVSKKTRKSFFFRLHAFAHNILLIS